jgi:FtsZ-binding cell division protein ZapB
MWKEFEELKEHDTKLKSELIEMESKNKLLQYELEQVNSQKKDSKRRFVKEPSNLFVQSTVTTKYT